MSKIICDVCGTRYPDSSEQCPICGCVRGGAANEPEQTIPVEDPEVPARPVVRGGRFSKANVRKRNKNQSVYEEPEVRSRAVENDEEYDPEEEFEEEYRGKGGTVLNVLLVIVIMALLAVSAYIFLNFFMPNMKKEEAPTVPTEAYVEETEAPTEAPEPTEPPTVPCEQLVLDITDVTLRQAGDMYLLNVQILPEGTTDGIIYISSNEEVATVNDEGRVTAVGEGSVVISILCGEQQIQCNVVCDFYTEETEAPATEGATEGATEAPTEAPAQNLKNVTLKVKSTDMTFRSGGQQATIKMSCDLKVSEVTWTSENPAVATVTADGVITRVGAGTTTIIGQYGEQKVEITVRCPSK